MYDGILQYKYAIKMKRKRNKLLAFLRDREGHARDLYWIRKFWYIILLIVLTVYVLLNFKTLANHLLISQFDGKSLLFILWILLLLIPNIPTIEGYGFKFIKEQESHDLRSMTKDVISNEDSRTIADLQKKLKQAEKESRHE